MKRSDVASRPSPLVGVSGGSRPRTKQGKTKRWRQQRVDKWLTLLHTKVTDVFEQRCCRLLVMTVDAEGIRITFRCIDPAHPKRRFYVVLKVNENEKWERSLADMG